MGAGFGEPWGSAATLADDVDELVAAVWPDAAAWVDTGAALRLMAAYVRRKRFEAEIMLSVWGGAMGNSRAGANRVSAAEMLALVGGSL